MSKTSTNPGDDATRKHIILLKLQNEYENAPDSSPTISIKRMTEQRLWLARAGALLKHTSNQSDMAFRSAMIKVEYELSGTVNEVKGLMLDAMADIELDLELDGRSGIGSVYKAGDEYKFFADLKEIIKKATKSIFIVDAYFDGAAFNDYLGNTGPNISIAILTHRYSREVLPYAQKHQQQFKSSISIRSSKDIHDRVLFIDDNECWIVGASLKDGGKKPTYLIPLPVELTSTKFDVYHQIFAKATEVK